MTDTLKVNEKTGSNLPNNGSEDDATFAQQIDRLPAGAVLNEDGVPTYMGMCGNKLIFATTATCGFSLFGYDQGVMSGLISGTEFIQTFPACDAGPYVDGPDGFPVGLNQTSASLWQATYTALYEIGCLAGAIFALFFGDRLGRRRIMQIGACIMLVGVLIQVTAFKGHMAAQQFVIGRIITGVGNGMNTATIPTWHAETAKSHNRGLLVCIEASMIASGTMVAYWIDYAFSFLHTSANWRIPIALQSIFAFGLLIGVYHLPESPRWLISNGQLAEGQRVVAALEPAPFDSEEVVLQTRVILESLEGAQKQKITDLLTNGPTQHFRRAAIGASSQIFQQIGGCNAVIYFAPIIFEQNLRLTRNMSLILGGVNVTVYAMAAFLSYVLIERVGRRKMFLLGSAGQALSMFIIMACLIPGTTEVMKGAVFGLFLYLAFFGFTWLELPWLYPAEINPLRTRTNANATSTICNWLFNFAIVEATPPLLTAINWGTFLIFGVVNVCFIPIIYIWYPETAGRTLEEIDIIFAVAYVEKRSYVAVAAEMPSLSQAQIESEGRRLGISDVLEDNKHGGGGH
ncbi:hypothetical protein RQP46_002419 [Phenoliferia psychrophenolica]